MPTIIRNVSESLKASALHPLPVFLRTLENVIYFVFFQDLEIQSEAVNCPWMIARVEYILCGVLLLWCQDCNCLGSSWGFPLSQKWEGVEMVIEDQSSALRPLRVGRSCKCLSLAAST